MILVADSGSTKCDWALVDKPGITYLRTEGYNPFFHTPESIAASLLTEPDIASVKDSVTVVEFFGASCSSPDRCAVIDKGLRSVFKKAKIDVQHDLLAAALANYDGKPCICCILGTGSNSCFFNGKETREEVPALGHILGDEGSGSFFGKMLLRAYLYKHLPKELSRQLEQEELVSKERIFDGIKPGTVINSYLGSFMPFIYRHRRSPFLHKMLMEGFVHFLNIHVLCYENSGQYPVHFVGSVAWYFREEITACLNTMGLKPGHFTDKPIEALAKRHLDQSPM